MYVVLDWTHVANRSQSKWGNIEKRTSADVDVAAVDIAAKVLHCGRVPYVLSVHNEATIMSRISILAPLQIPESEAPFLLAFDNSRPSRPTNTVDKRCMRHTSHPKFTTCWQSYWS